MFWSLGLKIKWVVLKNVQENYQPANLNFLMHNYTFIKFIYHINEEGAIIIGYINNKDYNKFLLSLRGYFKFKSFIKPPQEIINYLGGMNWEEFNYQTHTCIWSDESHQQIIGAFLDQIFIGSGNQIPSHWGLILKNQQEDLSERCDYVNYHQLYKNWLVENPNSEPFHINFLMWYIQNYLN